ncbi:MAG: formyltransferase family protein [Legionellaceae bacterium]|nr:formyltransferase family protein [Legionellaceae bacterium]
MNKYKITIFGVKETTKIIAEYLHQNGIEVDLIVSIEPSVCEKNHIADYLDLESTAQLTGADYYCVKDYSLKHLDDDFFQKNEFEIGVVYGWQRLIPEAIIHKFSKGLFGFHASPDILPGGKGRSPLNWSIILGKTVLYNHLFKYSVEADAGDLYSITEFQINSHDTILTLLYKSLLIAKKEIVHLIHDANAGNIKLLPQQGTSYFFPKRSPEDGLIHFETQTTKEIVNLIRGVTKPFSGAFCFTAAGTKIVIWEAWAFDDHIDFSHYEIGEVIDNLYAMPIIKTTDGSIILKNYEGAILIPKDKLISGMD